MADNMAYAPLVSTIVDNSWRCWSFTKIDIVPIRLTHCTFIALQKFHSDHCFKRINIFANSPTIFRSPPPPPPKKKEDPHNSSSHCGSIADPSSNRGRNKLAFWFGVKARKGPCTVISWSFARSVDVVAWVVQRRFAYCGKFQKLFNGRGEIISNLVYSTSFPRNQKQQCRNRVH